MTLPGGLGLPEQSHYGDVYEAPRAWRGRLRSPDGATALRGRVIRGQPRLQPLLGGEAIPGLRRSASKTRVNALKAPSCLLGADRKASGGWRRSFHPTQTSPPP